MSKPTWLRITMALGVGCSITVGALSSGWKVAVLLGFAGFATALGGLYHDKPEQRHAPRKDEP
jgi:predicted Abi (CAAX) family protease